eukprot:6200234-Pleurochrysis_carterae.AAC.2
MRGAARRSPRRAPRRTQERMPASMTMMMVVCGLHGETRPSQLTSSDADDDAATSGGSES